MATSGYKQFQVTIDGLGPMLHHNGQLSDPTNTFSRQIKEITSKRKKTDADYQEVANLEFQASLYLDQRGNITVPERVIEANIHAGAKIHKEGPTALAGVFVDPGAVKFHYDGVQGADARMKDPSCRLTVQVRVQTARNMRTRPIFNDWTLAYKVSILEDIVNRDQLERWIIAAGRYKGLGDWRPRYGRFELTELR